MDEMTSVLFQRKPSGRKSKRPTLADFTKQYAKAKSLQELADHYQVTQPTVSTWLRYFRNKVKEEELKSEKIEQ